MKRIWITGASGHVGSALVELLDEVVYELFLTDKDVDVTRIEDVLQFCKINRPDVIINCASLTGLEACQADPDTAYQVNALGVRNVALAANEINAKVIHLSTDDVFASCGQKARVEFDEPDARSVYGKSKLAGEKMLTQMTNRFVIIRSSWVYGIGKDYVSSVLEAVKTGSEIVADEDAFASPTSAEELAKVICDFIEKDEFGIYHAVCQGVCSRYEFVNAILEYSGNTGKVKVTASKAEDAKNRGVVLDNMMLRLSGLNQPGDWREVLKDYIARTGGDE